MSDDFCFSGSRPQDDDFIVSVLIRHAFYLVNVFLYNRYISYLQKF